MANKKTQKKRRLQEQKRNEIIEKMKELETSDKVSSKG